MAKPEKVIPQANQPQSEPAEVYSRKDFLLEIDRHLEELEDLIRGNKNPTAGGVKQRFLRHLQQDRTWIRVQTNQASGGNFDVEERVNPLLNQNGTKKMIMGHELSERKPVGKNQFRPKKDEKLKFEDSVKNLYNAFISMSDASVIENLRTPGFDTLVRGVAKLSNVKDWESAEIDVELFADIREGIRENARNQKEESSFEAEFNALGDEENNAD